MSSKFQQSLTALERLSPDLLDSASRRARANLGSVEWRMGLCLLAMQRSGSFRKLGYATLTEYAEQALQLSGRKVASLLGAAQALEHLPLMSEAFRKGEICWTKVRSLHGLATPETEKRWLEFAAAHSSNQVANKVAVSPREWKRHQALKAHLAGMPIARSEQVEEVLTASNSSAGCSGLKGRTEKGSETNARSGASQANSEEDDASQRNAEEDAKCDANERPGSQGHVESGGYETSNNSRNGRSAAKGQSSRPQMPEPPKAVRLVFELTPDQYALYEQAESRVRARLGRRAPRAEVLKLMAEEVLSSGSARARARHQVLVHTVEGSDKAWNETERGVLPVSPEVLEQAKKVGTALRVDGLKSVEGVVAESSLKDAGVSDAPRAMPLKQPEVANASCATPLKHAGVSDAPKPTALKHPGVSGASCATPLKHPGVSETPEPTPRNHMKAWESASSQPTGTPIDRRATANEAQSPPPPNPKNLAGNPTETANVSQECARPTRNAVTPKRSPIPNGTLRRLYSRAKNCCERCGVRGGRLDVHHTHAVSEGGGNELECLKLLCPACHSLSHEADFARRADWRAAREAAMGKNRGRAEDTGTAEHRVTGHCDHRGPG